MKRILFVVPFLSGGGAERVVSIWTSELAKLGCDVHLLVYYRVDNEYLVDEKVKIHTIAQKGKSEYERMNIWQKIKALRKALKKIQPDIVLPFITHVGLMVSVAKIGLSLKVIETIRINPRYSPQKGFLDGYVIYPYYFQHAVLFKQKHSYYIFLNGCKKRWSYFPILLQMNSFKMKRFLLKRG